MKKAIKAGALGIGFSVLLVAAQAGAEEKAYVLAGAKLPPAGTIALVTYTAATPETPMTYTENGAEKSGTIKEDILTKQTLTFLGPDKFTRELTSFSFKRTIAADGGRQEMAAPRKSLEKVVVTYERKNGQWALTLPGGAKLNASQLKELDQEGGDKPFSDDETIYGTKPHKVGDKWEVDVSQLVSFGGAGKATGSMSCELTEIKKEQGLSVAVVKLTYDLDALSIASSGGVSGSAQFHIKGEKVITRCLDYPLELGKTVKQQVESETQAGPGVTMKYSAPTTATSAAVLKKR